MTTYQPGEIVLIQFPQTSGAKGLVRPALVLLDSGDRDVVVAGVTRQVHGTPFDVVISDWQGAGLLAASVARLHKIATLEKTLVQRQLGSLQATDRAAVASVLQKMFGNW